MGSDAKKSELAPGTLEMLILKTIERNAGPMRGYGIARYIKQVSNAVLPVEQGSLYPALQRLAIKGWVKAEWGQSEKNRRARLYKLTPAGRKQLKQEVADFERVLEELLRVMQPTYVDTFDVQAITTLAQAALLRAARSLRPRTG